VKRRQKRKLAILVALLVVLAGLGLWYWNYTQTKNLKLDLRVQPSDKLTAPEYLYSFGGTKANHLTAPVGVLADGGNVFVADSTGGQLFLFKENGRFVKTFGKGKVVDPLYIAKSPKDGLLYVTDRGKHALLKFTTAGGYVGEFDPKLPKDQLPTFKATSEWIPIALAFAPDGTLYVTDILKDQRMLVFGPDGSFVRSFGKAGVVDKATDLPGQFQFPNSVKVFKNEVWVVDSNNRRLEVFGLDGTFKRLVPLSGLPRGMVFLPTGSGVTKSSSDVYGVVDALTSIVTLYSTKGGANATFGEKGVNEGQFALPNDITVGSKSIIFISDNRNLRVQAWGWQSKVSPLPKVIPEQPAWCLLALPLLLLPLFFRRKKYYATADFVLAMAEAGALAEMQLKRTRWLVSEADYEQLSGITADGVVLSELLQATEYSDSDARALMERYATTHEQAAVLVAAQRAKLFCTNDADLRKLARMLEIETMNAEEYRAHFTQKHGR
jgi:DNA-binding beta-propeller fold protein YncE